MTRKLEAKICPPINAYELNLVADFGDKLNILNEKVRIQDLTIARTKY